MAKVKVGTGVCAVCGEGVVWKVSDTGSLSYTCQHCDFRVFVPKHSDACKTISAGLNVPAEKAVPAAPVATAKPEPVPEPTAAPKAKPKGIWDHLVTEKAA